MISVLIVDDDARVAQNHSDLVSSIPGFRVAGIAATGQASLDAVAEHRPDLVLLDLFLPDLSGVTVLQELRGPERPEEERVDVLVVTALRDVNNVRAAMRSGVVHYLLKPFPMGSLRDQLERYRSARSKLTRIDEATQRDVDDLFGLLRPASRNELPKGMSQATARLVADTLRQAEGDLSAADVAKRTGTARVTARRYLEHLCGEGRATLHMRYGSAGRPEHRYHWAE